MIGEQNTFPAFYIHSRQGINSNERFLELETESIESMPDKGNVDQNVPIQQLVPLMRDSTIVQVNQMPLPLRGSEVQLAVWPIRNSCKTGSLSEVATELLMPSKHSSHYQALFGKWERWYNQRKRYHLWLYWDIANLLDEEA